MASARDALADIEHKWVRALGNNSLTKLRHILRAIQSLEQKTDDHASVPVSESVQTSPDAPGAPA